MRFEGQNVLKLRMRYTQWFESEKSTLSMHAYQSDFTNFSRSASMSQITRLYLRALSDEERTSRIDAFLEKTQMPLDPAVREASWQTIQRTEW